MPHQIIPKKFRSPGTTIAPGKEILVLKLDARYERKDYSVVYQHSLILTLNHVFDNGDVKIASTRSGYFIAKASADHNAALHKYLMHQVLNTQPQSIMRVAGQSVVITPIGDMDEWAGHCKRNGIVVTVSAGSKNKFVELNFYDAKIFDITELEQKHYIHPENLPTITIPATRAFKR